jgi:hypothetical protein
MHDPREPHLTALKRILHYLCSTIDFGLLLHRRSSSTELVVYTDVDWAGVRTLAALHPATLSSWATTWCPSRPSASRWPPTPVPRRSTALSPTAWLRLPGSGSFLASSIALFSEHARLL